MLFPSKGLLSAVLGYPKLVVANVAYTITITEEPYMIAGSDSNIWFQTDNVGLGICKINIHELSNKCKLWAVSEGYHWDVHTDRNGRWYFEAVDIIGGLHTQSDTDFDGTIELCQKIFDNKNIGVQNV